MKKVKLTVLVPNKFKTKLRNQALETGASISECAFQLMLKGLDIQNNQKQKDVENIKDIKMLVCENMDVFLEELSHCSPIKREKIFSLLLEVMQS